ncbi:beta/gamma crystallin-related protein [Chamaesiphon sp. VAR_48_metabat_403]|uniref:beta/gamma crystallin-related protein n=1 Tax=Chamaesiphon sp. VAR_48_metabat_403 TaxID=2964700 RepID=UPI00286E2470|nr:beta/gamma crystallin-related protein [Chamaesiphon sp. VAR_48_metabat_403]
MLQFNKKLAALALLSVTSITGSMLIIANVSAQKSQPQGAVTLWTDSNLQGTTFNRSVSVPDLSQFGFDNKASSIAVINGQKWRFYEGKNFQGRSLQMGPKQSIRNLGPFNDRISSFKSVP